MSDARWIAGGIAVDDRGELGFVNDFNFDGVQRFYTVTNHQQGFVRAWHGHEHEAKYVTVVLGAALFGVVKIDDWQNPSRDLEVSRHVVSATNPGCLFIPAGHAHGYMTLTPGAKLMFFSTSTLEESAKDDYRFDARYWDNWNVVER
jgi:dTDP-4-dehydrorhamnose 3,5-epimerase